jgi:hypothetical protein
MDVPFGYQSTCRALLCSNMAINVYLTVQMAAIRTLKTTLDLLMVSHSFQLRPALAELELLHRLRRGAKAIQGTVPSQS